jgi:hypothetical protein
MHGRRREDVAVRHRHTEYVPTAQIAILPWLAMLDIACVAWKVQTLDARAHRDTAVGERLGGFIHEVRDLAALVVPGLTWFICHA